MLELGKQGGFITDYGMSFSKAGGEMVWIKFKIGEDDPIWFGSPWKRDGEVNEMCLQQLALCGFDVLGSDITDLAKGPSSGLLLQGESVEVYIADETTGDGAIKRRIKSIGEFGPNRASVDEVTQKISKEKLSKIKALGSKFPPRKKKNPSEPIPF